MTKHSSSPLQCLLILFCASFTSVSGYCQDTEIRIHTNIVGTGNGVQYEITEVIRLRETEDSNSLLVRDAVTGDRFVLEKATDYKERTSSWKIRDVKGDAFIETRFTLPYAAQTRKGALAEARENPMLSQLPTVMTVETNGGSWAGVHTNWDDWAELRKLRHEIRQVMSFYLLEGIERMRDSVFSQTAGQAFYGIVARFVLYDVDEQQDAKLKTVHAKPDCDFDSSFGMPCTEAQLKRLRKAAERNETPQRY